MCSLFGIIDYRGVLTAREKNKILRVLSRECEVRGTDATGIAYNFGGSIRIYKRPLAAHKMHFHIPKGVNVIMGHTRMTTQGHAKCNYNNHPWSAGNFALAHNGVLWNDRLLRVEEALPPTKIETDSYIAVQLLDREKALNFDTIQTMVEKVQGSFVFTILDKQNNIYFVRGENPLAIFCYDGFYLYASTPDILRKTERQLRFRHHNTIETKEGDILKIDKNGKRSMGSFTPQLHWPYRYHNFPFLLDEIPMRYEYLFDAAKAMGVSEDEVQALLDYGCDTDEIEDLLYDPVMLHEITAELRYSYV